VQRGIVDDGPLEAQDVLLGSAAEGLDEQVVHRAEVVVDQLGFEAGSRGHPP
jgi:hypothetical protein